MVQSCVTICSEGILLLSRSRITPRTRFLTEPFTLNMLSLKEDRMMSGILFSLATASSAQMSLQDSSRRMSRRMAMSLSSMRPWTRLMALCWRASSTRSGMLPIVVTTVDRPKSCASPPGKELQWPGLLPLSRLVRGLLLDSAATAALKDSSMPGMSIPALPSAPSWPIWWPCGSADCPPWLGWSPAPSEYLALARRMASATTSFGMDGGNALSCTAAIACSSVLIAISMAALKAPG
mmetsp:Transcript_20471/g.57315  ORF Transcript_20471/g.57315 Transcript_20471/m.57315 type:complete len:237 (-) Transcript_20471:983-1693(-)